MELVNQRRIIQEFIVVTIAYILEGATTTKTSKDNKEVLLKQFWNWIRPFFITVVPAIKQAPSSISTKEIVFHRLIELTQKDEKFLFDLQNQIARLQEAGIKPKIT